MDQHNNKKYSVSTLKIVLITFLTTTILIVGGWYFFVFDKQTTFAAPVQMVEVAQGDLDVEIVSTGELLALGSNPVLVSESLFCDFPVSEIDIMEILPEGTRVEKGDIIAWLDNAVYRGYKSKIESELADIENKIDEITLDSTKQLKDVKLALENARLDLEIRKIAVDQSLFDPVSAHERMKLEFSKSKLAYENALFNYLDRRKPLLEKYAAYPAQAESLRNELSVKLPSMKLALEVRSPYSGILRYAEGANKLKIGAGSKLTPKNMLVARIEDVRRLVSRCFLEEEYFTEISEGQEIKVFLKSNAIEIEAKISHINKKIEPIDGKKCFAVETIVDNTANNLLPGQTTINKISLSLLENVLYLPNSAVLEEGDRFYVFVEGGTKREIKCKKVSKEFSQVLSGLSLGQLVYLDVSSANK
jgi:multidrug efflux pump subunit AcrA (membrane-fusion protein)